MNTLIVYDTSFGNTERIADAICDGLEAFGEVRVVTAAEADIGPAVDLLLVGGPTQRHGLSPGSPRCFGALLRGRCAGSPPRHSTRATGWRAS